MQRHYRGFTSESSRRRCRPADWPGRDSNPHAPFEAKDFKSLASAGSATGPSLFHKNLRLSAEPTMPASAGSRQHRPLIKPSPRAGPSPCSGLDQRSQCSASRRPTQQTSRLKLLDGSSPPVSSPLYLRCLPLPPAGKKCPPAGDLPAQGLDLRLDLPRPRRRAADRRIQTPVNVLGLLHCGPLPAGI